MQAIDYVVRNGQGRVSRGELNGSDSKLVLAAAGNSDISLNIGQGDVQAYNRVGNDLVIQLDDGRQIVIEGLFDGNGGQTTRLYLSEGGEIQEITFTESWGRTNHAHLESAEGVDGLVFNDGASVVQADGVGATQTTSQTVRTTTTWQADEGLLLTGLLGLGGAGLAAAAGGILGGGGGGGAAAIALLAVSDEIRITNMAGGQDEVVNAAEMAAGPTISGITEANVQVTVTVQGISVVTMSDDNGEWTAVFGPNGLPAGEYQAPVTASAIGASGNTLTATSVMNVDTFTQVTVDAATIEGDGVILATEAADGVQLTGTGEAGANVSVNFQGATQSTTVLDDGTWTVTFSPASAAGLNDQLVVLTAESTDAAGNISSTTQTVRVDTVINVAFDDLQMGDNVINETEAQSPVTFTGTTDSGNHVIIDLNGILHDATVDSNGAWTVTFQPYELPSGNTPITLVATATDALGNSNADTHVVNMDSSGFVNITSAPVSGDNLINADEASDGITIGGNTLPGSTVVVDFHGFTGNAVVASNGTWTIDIPSSAITPGQYDVNIVATSTSSFGNVSSTDYNVTVDTFVDELSYDPVTGDNIINLTEYQGGVTVNGTVEEGSSVNVTIHETTKPATVNSDGTWSVTFLAGEYPHADYTAALVVAATDAAGNTIDITSSVYVDTVGNSLSLDPLDLGPDGILSGDEADDGVTLTGTSEPNVDVTIEFNGTTITTTTDDDGNWVITLGPDDIGDGDGIVPLVITTVDPSGNVTTVTQDVDLDTQVSNVTFPSNLIATDGIVNNNEIDQVITIDGTAEIGSTVIITIGNVDYNVPVDGNGNWVLNLPPNTFQDGNYDAILYATITDSAGNSVSQTTTVHIDTSVSNFAVTSTTMDNYDVLNSYVAQTGIEMHGTVEQGATVEVTFMDVTKLATVTNGTWSVTFAGDEVPVGEYVTNAIVVATDTSGNVDTQYSQFVVDTAIPDAPEITAITEDSDGMRSIAMPYSNDQFVISAVSDDGTSTTEIDTHILHDTFHNELLFNFADDVPDGTDLIVQLNDAAGNTSSTLFILDDNASVDMGADALDGFAVGAVDLAFAQDSHMTITADQLEGLSDLSNNLLVRGETGDTVTAIGAAQTSETEVIEGQTYDIYTLGSNGAYMLIDQQIEVITF